MKTRNWMMAFALLWTATWANDLFAQKHLDALIKRCETMKDVQIEEVYSKDKKTKKPERRITTIRFSKKKTPSCWRTSYKRSSKTRRLLIIL